MGALLHGIRALLVQVLLVLIVGEVEYSWKR